jgi:hypothetical protein
MSYRMRLFVVAGIAMFIVLNGSRAIAQSNLPLELPKVEEPKIISIAYGNKGVGRVMAADKNGKVQQYLEVWENASKVPNVVTYVLVLEGNATYTSTWGRGPINPSAFVCKAETTPEFGEKTLWVAVMKDNKLKFEEITDEDVKGLFTNLTQARRDWNRAVNSANQRNNANTVQINILGFLKEKNRKKWLGQGWLQNATSCVQHF